MKEHGGGWHDQQQPYKSQVFFDTEGYDEETASSVQQQPSTEFNQLSVRHMDPEDSEDIENVSMRVVQRHLKNHLNVLNVGNYSLW